VDDTASPDTGSGLGAFLRLWLVIWFAYALLKFAFNLLVLNAIDLRVYSIVELFVLPLGQTIVVWFVGRGRRAVVR